MISVHVSSLKVNLFIVNLFIVNLFTVCLLTVCLLTSGLSAACADSGSHSAALDATAYRDVSILYKRAAGLIEEHRFEAAVLLFEEINTINPYIAEVHGNLGYLYEVIGKQELAEAEYRTAIEIKPDYADALNNLGYLLARRGEDIRESLELCRDAVTIASDNPAFHDSYGYVLFRMGKVSEAFIHFQRALFYDKNSASTYYHLGLIYREKDDLEKAREHFEKAVSYRNSPGLAYLRLAQTLVEMGKLSDATEVLGKARWVAEKKWISPASRVELTENLTCFMRMGILQGLVEVELAGSSVADQVKEKAAASLEHLPMKDLSPDVRKLLSEEQLSNYYITTAGLVKCRKHGYNPMATVLKDRVRAQRGPYLERKGRLLMKMVEMALARKELKEGRKDLPISGEIDVAVLKTEGYLPDNFGVDYIFSRDELGKISFVVTEEALAAVIIPPGLEIRTIAEARSDPSIPSPAEVPGPDDEFDFDQPDIFDSAEGTEEAFEDGVSDEELFDDEEVEEGEDLFGTPEETEEVDVATPPAAVTPPVQPAVPAFDMTQFIQAPPIIAVSPDFKVGWAIRQKLTTAYQSMDNYYAIVGESGSSWHIEHVGASLLGMAASYPDLKSMLMGLEVDKKSGLVSRAVLGKPGEKGKEIKVPAMPDIPKVDLPEPVDEDVTIALGTFPAKKYVTSYATTWTGVKGDLDEVLLRSDAGGQSYELAEHPSKNSTKISGFSLTLKVLKYTNGMEYWLAENEVVSAFFPMGEAGKTTLGIAKMVTTAATQEVTLIETDVKAQLKW